MIICNPNMGYAECQIYDSNWPDFYLDYGINVVLWNYRGYGKSTGKPSPTNNRNDIEMVYNFAKE
jgi:pimeloyl-ACP methyl ester carboxylesterase